MKISKITTTLCLMLSVNAYAQTATTTSETSTNQTLLGNAKASRTAIDAKATVQQQIKTLNGTNASSTNLTDQEKELSENYIHQGKANEVLKENCSGSMATVCNGNVGSHKFLGMDPNMVKAISQAYAMFGALAGDNFGAISKGDAALKEEAKTNGKAAEVSATKADEKAQKANDYCKYIPTMTEGVATAVQMAKTSELNATEIGNGDTAQKDALLKAAKSHDSRAKMAQIQAAGWWGGAACYAVNAATGQFATDKNLIIKMGAATLLGAFYQNEVSANKDYADRTRNIANQLPGKGDCNPITDNLCYCSQESTQNDTTYCAKGLHNKNISSTSYRVACTDSNMKIDATCACEKSNSCFETYLEAQSGGTLDLAGMAYSNSPFSAIRSLGRGELVGSTITSASYDKTAAIAKKALNEMANKVPMTDGLTKDQQAIAKAIMSKGVPANVANLMASNPPNQSAVNAAMAKISNGASGVQVASVSPKSSNNIVDFSGGSGLGVKGAIKNGSETEDILAKMKLGGSAKGAVNSKIIEFAQKAENNARATAQIRQGDDTPLFEIISMRYRTSGRRLLEVDAN